MITENDVRQYSLPPLLRQVINLKTNRSNGERFSQISGQFFYVESVDLPCRVSFGPNGSESQSVALSSGFQINAPFSEFSLFHDDYSLASSNINLIVYTSAYPRAFNQYVNPAVQIQLPYTDIDNSTPTYQRVTFPIFPRTRFLSLYSILIYTQVADPGPALVDLSFFDINNNPFFGPVGLVRNGITYNLSTSPNNSFEKSSALVAGASWYYSFSKQNVVIPSGADRVKLGLTFFSTAPVVPIHRQSMIII